jgi:hypothetical protein
MRKENKRYNQIIAVDLIDRMKEIEQNPPKIIGFTISRLQYLISLILSHKQDNHPGVYSLLHMPYILNVIPQADKYLKFLKDQNIIQWKNYCAGRNSRMYRLINEGKTEFRAITDKKLIRRIEKNRISIAKRNSKKYPALNSFIYKIKIDHESALKTIESVYQQNKIMDIKNAEGRRTFSLSEINRIQNDEIYIKVNPTNGRLDSNYTRLPGELIQHLTIDGNPLIELDIRNSQPFFAGSLFNPTSEIENIINKYCGHSLTMLLKSLQVSECKDVKLYLSLVTEGTFYDPFLMDKFNENGIHYDSRDDLKKQLFVIFFGKNNADKYSNPARLFKSIFPNVQKVFDLIKKDQYNALAILLQRIESYTILERVSRKILTELPGLPFITRHDSLLPSGIMVYKDADKVKNIMLTTIKEVTGISPLIRIKSNSKKLKGFFAISLQFKQITI